MYLGIYQTIFEGMEKHDFVQVGSLASILQVLTMVIQHQAYLLPFSLS
jgi:hypothetical protein